MKKHKSKTIHEKLQNILKTQYGINSPSTSIALLRDDTYAHVPNTFYLSIILYDDVFVLISVKHLDKEKLKICFNLQLQQQLLSTYHTMQALTSETSPQKHSTVSVTEKISTAGLTDFKLAV